MFDLQDLIIVIINRVIERRVDENKSAVAPWIDIKDEVDQELQKAINDLFRQGVLTYTKNVNGQLIFKFKDDAKL